jgi:hypothetical protein
MMNDEMEQLERRLGRQPLRQVPPEWRAEILAAARDPQASRHPLPVTRHQKPSWPSSILHSLSSLLWPHPKAWAGLAAVWIFILAVNFSMRDSSPRLAEKSAPLSPEMIVELRQQQRLFAELVGPRETRDADRPQIFTPKPRGERTEILAAV